MRFHTDGEAKSGIRLPCSVRRYKDENHSMSLDILQLLLLDYIAVGFVAQR